MNSEHSYHALGYFCRECGAPQFDSEDFPSGWVVPQGFRERELSRHVGAFVMSMAELDGILAAVVGIFASRPGGPELKKSWGKSGCELATELEKLSPKSGDILDIAAKYRDLYKVRNQMVHAIQYDHSGKAGILALFKANKIKGGSEITPGELIDEYQMSISQLTEAWCSAQSLKRAAKAVFVANVFT